MSIGLRQSIQLALAALVISAIPAVAGAQREGLLSGNIKYNSGQSVQPIFEGWTRNVDGTYQFHFGYLNRNHVEELQVPIGAANQFDSGPADRGQPTYFYTRFNRRLFSVTVPADWGTKELVWTLTTHGMTERAVAWLRADWEIALPGAAADGKNQPPALAVEAQPRVTLPAALTLTATVTDDGLPQPRPAARGRGTPNRPPAFDNSGFKSTTPVNVPQVERPARPRVTDRLQVEWFVWRGPAAVTFTPPVAGADKGNAVVEATFTEPGEYVLRARATDSQATVLRDVKVVVAAAPR